MPLNLDSTVKTVLRYFDNIEDIMISEVQKGRNGNFDAVVLAPNTAFNLALDQYFADHGEERLGKNFYKVMMSKRPKMQLRQDEVVGGRKLFGETVNPSLAVEDIQI